MQAIFYHKEKDVVDNNITGKRKQVSCSVISFFLCFCSLLSIAQKPVLIEFGWDYPDVKMLSQRIDSIQNTPFDGICFSLQRSIMEAFDTTLKSDDYFEHKKLQAIKWGQYTNNFIIVRGFSKTGGNWFDDSGWIRIEKNITGLSKAMKAGGLKGIFFDPEYYYKDPLYNPWTYNKSQYPDHSFYEVTNKVKQRGTRFVEALQKYKASFTFLSIWITSLIAEERKYTPIEKTRHALLISFIEGMLEGKKQTVTITDGNEYAYWNNKPSQFAESAAFLKKNLTELLNSQKAKSIAGGIKIAQPFFYDGLMATSPAFDKGADNQTKWTWLDENIKQALAATDNIVWFYSQRINWWKGGLNDTLVSLIEKNKSFYSIKRQRLKTQDKTAPFVFGAGNINNKTGVFYESGKTGPVKIGRDAFTYKWVTPSKKLIVNFTDSIPALVNIYINNVLKKTFVPQKRSAAFFLPGFGKGKMIILLKYKNNTEAAAIQVNP